MTEQVRVVVTCNLTFMKKALLYLFLVTAPAAVLAQAPGYMGKKVTVIYNNYFSPALKYPNYRDNQGILSFNSRHSFGVDYVRARKRTIGLAVQFLRTRKVLEGAAPVSITDFQYFYNVSASGDTTLNFKAPFPVEAVPNGGDILISNRNISLYWKFFGSKYIAPWGNYHRIDFVYMSYKVKQNLVNSATYTIYDQYNMQATGNTNQQARVVSVPPPNDDNTYSSFMFAYGVGKQRILYDKVILDFGAQLGFMFSAAGANGRMGGSELFNANMQKRINNASWFNINIGIGYLAY